MPDHQLLGELPAGFLDEHFDASAHVIDILPDELTGSSCLYYVMCYAWVVRSAPGGACPWHYAQKIYAVGVTVAVMLLLVQLWLAVQV